MDNKIPAALQPAFERSAHPYLMWDGIQSIPEGLEEILAPGPREAVRKAAQAMQGRTPVHLVGAGTSYFAAISIAYALQSLASYPAHGYNAFEFAAYPPPNLRNNTVIGISHTGGTPAVIDALELARREGATTAGFSDVQESALARAADHLVVSRMGREPALPKTRSYNATLLRGYLTALELARLQGAGVERYEAELQNAPANARQGLQAAESQAQALARQYTGTSRMVVVGGGPNWATAMEASLKLTEAALVDSTPWEMEEAVHGTWASTKTGDLVIILALKGRSYDKAVRLAEGMQRIDVEVWAITDSDEKIPGARHLTRLPAAAEEVFQPLYAVLPLYQFAYFLALEKGIHPDIMRMDDPRYLQARTLLRSTVK